MRAARLDVDGVEARARRHEEPVALRAAEADVGADLRQQNLADALAVLAGENVHPVVARADPAGARPEVALGVAADAVGEARLLRAIGHLQFHRGKFAATAEFFPVNVPHFDIGRCVLIVTPTGVGDVEFFVVGREAEPVGFENLVGHPVDLAGRSVDHIDGLLLVGLHRGVGGAGALVIHQRTVAGIGEPDVAVGVDDGVVGRVELLAVDFFREHGDAAVGFVACDAAREVFARDLSALIVEGIAVGIIRRLTEDADVAVLLEPAQLAVVGDVAPEQVAPDSVPSRAFGPQHVRVVVETLDRGVAELGLETLVERDDVWIGITGRHAAGPIALGCARQRRQRRHGQRRRRAAEKRPAVGSRRRAGCETETGILECGGIRGGSGRGGIFMGG